MKYPHQYWVLKVKGMPDAECNSRDYADRMARAHNDEGRDVSITTWTIISADTKPVKGGTQVRKAPKK